MVMWLLTKEVMTLRGEESNFNDMPDLFMWRDVEKERKEEKQAEEVNAQNMDDGEVEGDGAEDFLDDDAQN